MLHLYCASPNLPLTTCLSSFYARCMGLPVEKLVVATNRNDILSRFFQHGDYSARAVQPSLAPAMDIVVPSNFERFLYVLLKQDSQRCKGGACSFNSFVSYSG